MRWAQFASLQGIKHKFVSLKQLKLRKECKAARGFHWAVYTYWSLHSLESPYINPALVRQRINSSMNMKLKQHFTPDCENDTFLAKKERNEGKDLWLHLSVKWY